MNQEPTNIDGVWSAMRGLLIAIGGIMVANGWAQTKLYFWVMTGAGCVMIVGPAAWGVVVAIRRVKWKNIFSAQAVQAGVNLTTSGNSVDHEGNPISKFSPDASPPKPVTVESAQQIIKDYAPLPAEVAKN